MLMSIALFSFTKNDSTTKNNPTIMTKTIHLTDGAIHYQKNFEKFNYYIETIGDVSIDNVALDDGKLTALYTYSYGNEIRNVVSALTLDSDGIYKGTCTTIVNGKVLFAVNTWLTFSKNGTASGNWSWSGTPSKNNPIITISTKQ